LRGSFMCLMFYSLSTMQLKTNNRKL